MFFLAITWLVCWRQTKIQVDFVDLYGSCVYVICFISCPPNCVRKLLYNLQTLKAHHINISPVPSLSTQHSMTFTCYSSWSLIEFTSWMDWTYKYSHRSLLVGLYWPRNYTDHCEEDYTNMDGQPAPSTAWTCFCNPQWLRYSLLHHNWWWKISSLHCSCVKEENFNRGTGDLVIYEEPR